MEDVDNKPDGVQPTTTLPNLEQSYSEQLKEVESKYSCVIYCNTSKLREIYQEKKKSSRWIWSCDCKAVMPRDLEMCIQRGRGNESEMANEVS